MSPDRLASLGLRPPQLGAVLRRRGDGRGSGRLTAMSLQLAPRRCEPRPSRTMPLRGCHPVERRMEKLRECPQIRGTCMDKPRAPKARSPQGRGADGGGQPSRGVLRRLLRGARRARRGPERQAWLVFSSAGSAWKAELGRLGVAAVHFTDAGGWGQLRSSCVRDELGGWLALRDLCGLFIARTGAQLPAAIEELLAAFERRSRAAGLSIASISRGWPQSRGMTSLDADTCQHVIDACAFGHAAHVRLCVSLCRARVQLGDALRRGRSSCEFSNRRHQLVGRSFVAPLL